MKLLLIDGYGFVFRAYHSLPPLTRKDGTPIGAIYGFCNMLYKFVSNNKDAMIAVVLDSGQKNFRHDIYPEYKANRPPAPEDLVPQFPIIREAVEAFNLKVLEKVGYEADDLIATYAKEAKNQGFDVTVVSSDKDLMQLMEYGINLYDAMKDKPITEEDVAKKFFVTPDKIRDVLALMGDSSDNIPGVSGIGPKTAAELINQYSNLDGVYNNVNEIKQQKRRETLIAEKENAYLSFKLVGLDDKAPMDFSLNDLQVHEIDNNKLLEFLNFNGFKALYSRVKNDFRGNELIVSKPQTTYEFEFKELAKDQDISKLIPKIQHAGELFFLESDEIFSFGCSNEFYRLKISEKKKQESLFDEPISNDNSNHLELLKPIFEDDSIKKVTFDSKFLYKKLKSKGIEAQNIQDIGVMAYNIETGKNNSDLVSLIAEYCPNKDADALALYNIYSKIYEKIISLKHVALYEKVDKNLPKVVAEIEFRGIKIDPLELANLSREFKQRIANLEKNILEVAGKEFNIGSPKQLGEILFEHMNLPAPKRSKTGAYPTGADVLEDLLVKGFKIAKDILEWRKLSKLVSTYTEALPKAINPETGRVHTTFMITHTSTGRFSSNEPNLQNIPIRTEEGNKIRKAFSAKAGYKIISADYSQIELRLLAHYAKIDSMKEAFRQGRDIHATTASEMFNVPIDNIDSDLRRKAKAINFGIIYGMSAFGLSERLDITRDAAKKYIEHYFEKYPGIKEYMNQMISFAREHGYVNTISGRKCYVAGINDKNPMVRNNADRAAINFPLQGTAADVIKRAMIMMPEVVSKYMVLQVHDELLFEVPENQVESSAKIIKRAMESAFKLSVPLTVEVKCGNNWMEAH